jgi:hypothetical protein
MTTINSIEVADYLDHAAERNAAIDGMDNATAAKFDLYRAFIEAIDEAIDTAKAAPIVAA